MINQIRQLFRYFNSSEQLLLVLLFVLLPSQIGKHFWPDFASIFSLRVDYFSPVIYLWDLLLIGLLIVWFIGKPKINQSALSLGLVFLLSQIASLVFTDNLEIGLVRLEQLFLMVGFGVYLASQKWIKIRSAIVLGFSAGLLIQALLVIYQFGFGKTLGWWWLGEREFNLNTTGIATFNWYGQVFLRPYGTFSHPNVLAGVSLLMVLSLILAEWRRWWMVGIASVMILLTFSRTAIIGLLGLSLVLWNGVNRWLVGLLVLSSPLLLVRFWSALNFDYLSWLRRNELVEAAQLIWRDNLWLGVGLNSFIIEMANNQLISGANRFLQPVHNVGWLLLAETGIVGLIGFGIMIAGVLFQLLKYRGHKLVFILWCGWIAIAWVGLWDHYWLTLAQGQRMLWCWWGLSLAIIVKISDEDYKKGN